MIRMIKYVSVFLVVFWLSGCVGAGPKHIDNAKRYTITTNAVKSSQNTKSDKIIKVLEPITNRELDATAMLYSEDKFSLDGYALSQWSDTPASMLQKAMSDTLDNSDLYKGVVTSRIKTKSDHFLQSELRQFKQIFENGNSYGILEIKIFLIDAQKRELISSKRFHYKIKAPSNNARGAVISLNKASKNMLEDMRKWIEASLKNTQNKGL